MTSKKNMSDYKVLTRKLYPSPKRVQELIPVFKIGIDGVFQLEDLPDGVERGSTQALLQALKLHGSILQDCDHEQQPGPRKDAAGAVPSL